MTPKLSAILARTRERVRALHTRQHALEAAARRADAPRPWDRAFRDKDVTVIAEIKRRSPSVGDIAPQLVPAAHARRYVEGGARAVSVLTEPTFFSGSAEDFAEVLHAVPVPLLRKDFLIDPLQLFETRAMGASAALLIVRALDDAQLAELSSVAADLGLARLVEVHDAYELERALRVDPEAIGVNSRDLDTFAVALDRIAPILRAIPPPVLAVAESGIVSRDDVERVASWGANAILVGTALARAADPAAGVRAFTGVRRGERRNEIEPAPGGSA